MPASAPLTSQATATQLDAVGQHIRTRRKALRISAIAAAEAAGMSRVTLHRIETGEASVTMGAYLNAMAALGLVMSVAPQAREEQHVESPKAGVGRVPARIRLADHPQLARLAWHAPGLTELTPAEALSLYERNWRHLDRDAMGEPERALLAALVSEHGKGHLLV
ncbi:MAG: helix-turn-helix domain-containing protein [Rhizobacter sp.]